MALKHAWLWETKHRADATLKILRAGGKGDPVATLPVHTAVLGSASQKYFRAKFRRWEWDHRQAILVAPQPDNQAGPPEKPCSSSASVPILSLEVVCEGGEPDGVPEAVIKHAYTGELPAGDDAINTLIWMMWRAECLDMPDTEDACSAKLQQLLSAHISVSLSDITRILIQPTIRLWLDQPSPVAKQLIQAISNAAERELITKFDNTRNVLIDSQLLAQFVQLPFPLLVQWAKSNKLVVDYENTMAVLFTAWYDHQSSTSTPPTPEQCGELSRLLNLTALGSTFLLQVMSHLHWFNSPPNIQDFMVHAVLTGLDPDVEPEAHMLRRALAGSSTNRQSKDPCNHVWLLSQQQLQTLWDNKYLDMEGTIYIAGYNINVMFSLECEPVQDTCTLGGVCPAHMARCARQALCI